VSQADLDVLSRLGHMIAAQVGHNLIVGVPVAGRGSQATGLSPRGASVVGAGVSVR